MATQTKSLSDMVYVKVEKDHAILNVYTFTMDREAGPFESKIEFDKAVGKVVGTEKVSVKNVEYECTIVETHGTRTWIARGGPWPDHIPVKIVGENLSLQATELGEKTAPFRGKDLKCAYVELEGTAGERKLVQRQWLSREVKGWTVRSEAEIGDDTKSVTTLVDFGAAPRPPFGGGQEEPKKEEPKKEEKKDDKKDDKKEEKKEEKKDPPKKVERSEVTIFGMTFKAEPPGPPGHRDQVFTMALTKDGKFLATGSSDKTVKLWEVATGRVVREFPNPDFKPVLPGEAAPSHPGWVQSVRLTPDGQFLVSAGPAPRGKSYLAVWKVSDGKRVYGSERDFGPIHSVAVTPDGTKLVIGSAVGKGKTEPDALVIKLPGR
jgi:hypothetical protein